MERRCASPSPYVDAMPDEVMERMRRADSLVRPWVDSAFRAQINPDAPEVVGPPTRLNHGRIRRGI